MAAVTVATTTRGWYEGSSTVNWCAKLAFVVSTNLYVVTVDDSGGSPKLRVHKSTSQSAPSFSEQDSAHNVALSSVNYPFSAWLAGTAIHIAMFSAANTITHQKFETSTDLWGTSLGNATTAASNERAIRIGVRSDGDVLICYTSSADDADLLYARNEVGAWTSNVSVHAASNAASSNFMDAWMDSTDEFHTFFYAVDEGDVQYRSISSANSAGTDTDISVQSLVETQSVNGNYEMYQVGTTDTVSVVQYKESNGSLINNVISLETSSSSGDVASVETVYATDANIGARTTLTTAKYGTDVYCMWWDDANSGTLFYSRKVGVWNPPRPWKVQSEGSLVSTPNNAIQLLSIASVGLLAFYQDGTAVKCDFVPIEAGFPFKRKTPNTLVRM